MTASPAKSDRAGPATVLSLLLLLLAGGFCPRLEAAAVPRAGAAPAPEGWSVVGHARVQVAAPERAGRMAEDLASRVPEILTRIDRDLGIGPMRRPLTVYLVPDGAALGELRRSKVVPTAPRWAAGYALRGRGVVVLNPSARLGPFVRGFQSVLVHELVHARMDALLGDRAGEAPAWFWEGVASVLAHEGAMRDLVVLTRTALQAESPELEEISQGFPANESRARAAYVVSHAFVGHLVAQEGTESLGELTRRVAEGEAFPAAFEEIYGAEPAAIEAGWRRGFVWKYRWIPILTSSTTMWLAITGLVLVAAWRRRRRNRKKLERWEEEWRQEEWRQEDGPPWVH